MCCIVLCIFTSSSHSHPLPPSMALHANGNTATPARVVATEKSTGEGLNVQSHSNSNPLIATSRPSANNDNPSDPPLQPPAVHESTSTSTSIPSQIQTSNNLTSTPASNENNNIKSLDAVATLAEEQSNGINPAPKQSRTLSSTMLDAIASTPMSSSLSLPKSPEKISKMSILSVIHPALHAAFSSEKPSEKPVATKPLTKIEYHSLPLRGTEARDRAALGLLSRVSSSTSSSSVHGTEGGAPPASEDLNREHLQTAVHAQQTWSRPAEKDSSFSSSVSKLRSTASESGSESGSLQPYDVTASTVVTNLRDSSGSAQAQEQYMGNTPVSMSAAVDTQRNSPENIVSSHVRTHSHPHVQSEVLKGQQLVSRAANIHDGATSTGSGTEPETMTVPSIETDESRTGTESNHQYQSQQYSEQNQSVGNDANSYSSSNKYGPPGSVIGHEASDNSNLGTFRKSDYPDDINVVHHVANPSLETSAVDYGKSSTSQTAPATTSGTSMVTGSRAFGLGTALDSLNTGELAARAIAARKTVESAWRRMMSKVKQTVGSVLSPKPSLSSSLSASPTPSILSPSSPHSLENNDGHLMKKHKPMDAAAIADAAARNMGNLDLSSNEKTAGPGFKKTAASKTGKDKGNNYAYTSEEIDELVSDIMLQIQMHQDEMRAHKDMLRKTGRWHPEALTPHEIEKGLDGSPIIILRSSVLVSPDKLAEAVTSSTKKLLLTKGSPIPWPVASRLLVDVHSRLAQLIEPHALRQLMAQAQAQARTQALYQHDDGVGHNSGDVQGSDNGLKKENKPLENVSHGIDENKRPTDVGKSNLKGKETDAETARQQTKENELNQDTGYVASDVNSATSEDGSGSHSSTKATGASIASVKSIEMQEKLQTQPQMHHGEDVTSTGSQELAESSKLGSDAQSRQENKGEEQISSSISEESKPSRTTDKQTGQQDNIGEGDADLHGDTANADIRQQQPHLTDSGGVEGAHHHDKSQRDTGEIADVAVAGNHQSNGGEDHEGRDDHAHRSIERSFEAKISHDDAAHASANAHSRHTHL